MIGHYLLTLTPEQEDRLLISVFWRYDPNSWAPNQCLVQVAENLDSPYKAENVHWRRGIDRTAPYRGRRRLNACPADRYDDLCEKFGENRVNAAIRNRILSNKARRKLASHAVAVCPT